MSIINATLDSAVAIAERRSHKASAGIYAGRAGAVLMRNFYALKTSNAIAVISGFFEPVLYLLSFGYGIGSLMEGEASAYAMYIMPALLATSAMNGAIYDSTWNVYFKMHFGKLYQTMMSTSLGPLDVALGEIGWALLRGLVYAIGFMIVVTPLGLVTSWWALLAIPAAVLIAFGFASVGMGVTSYLKSFQQMNWVNFVLLPMFLFSGTFFDITKAYPDFIVWMIQALPLWHAIELVRGLMTGMVGLATIGHVLYFVVMIAVGLLFTTKRLTALFLR
ncbi:MAG: ABC transporter permease [Micrococcales bacterium]